MKVKDMNPEQRAKYCEKHPNSKYCGFGGAYSSAEVILEDGSILGRNECLTEEDKQTNDEYERIKMKKESQGIEDYLGSVRVKTSDEVIKAISIYVIDKDPKLQIKHLKENPNDDEVVYFFSRHTESNEVLSYIISNINEYEIEEVDKWEILTSISKNKYSNFQTLNKAKETALSLNLRQEFKDEFLENLYSRDDMVNSVDKMLYTMNKITSNKDS